MYAFPSTKNSVDHVSGWHSIHRCQSRISRVARSHKDASLGVSILCSNGRSRTGPPVVLSTHEAFWQS